MKHITSTAIAAGAQIFCAAPEGQSLPGMGSVAQQPAFRPILRREIMSAVNSSGRDLGLRPGAVVVLDALLSCLPCQGPDRRELPVTPATLLTVYASNETLCFRAKGLTDRQLRRHIDTLEKAGLLLRRDSSNGKRFPVMKGGKAIGAFGLDLSPLFARADDLIRRAQKLREQAEELRGVRAQILQLRAVCLELTLDDVSAAFIDGLRNLIRRASLTLVEARAVIARLTAVIAKQHSKLPVNTANHATATPLVSSASEADAECLTTTEIPSASTVSPVSPSQMNAVAITATLRLDTGKTPATDGQNVRHKEPDSDTKKQTRTPNKVRDGLN